MKTLLAAVALALISAIGASAQTRPVKNPLQHADMADQRTCYEQARVVVDRIAKEDKDYAEKNNSNAIGSQINYGISYLGGAHFDAASKTCYVERIKMTTMSFGTLDKPDSVRITIMNQVEIEDAFEGKSIASFFGTSTKNGAGENPFEDAPPSVCQVNGEKCDSRAVFNGLLWKLIPAFRPVDAKDIN